MHPEFEAAAQSTLQAQEQTVEAIALITKRLIEQAWKLRGENPAKNPKIEIYAGRTKAFPSKDGSTPSPEKLKTLQEAIAQNKGSVRIFQTVDGKREKIYHAVNGKVQTDKFNLKEKLSQSLKTGEVNLEATVEQVEALKNTPQSKDSKSIPGLDHEKKEGEYQRPAPPIKPFFVRETEQSIADRRAGASKEIQLEKTDVRSPFVAKKVKNGIEISLNPKAKINDHNRASIETVSQGFKAGATTQQSAKAVLGENGTYTLTSKGRLGIEPSQTVEKSQSQTSAEPVPKTPSSPQKEADPVETKSLEKGDQNFAQDEKSSAPDYPKEAVNQASVSPAFKAAEAEFERRLEALQKEMGELRQGINTLTEKLAPYLNEEHLQEWAQQGKQRHKAAMTPLKERLENLTHGFKTWAKEAGRKLYNEVSSVEAKMIEAGVSKLVNSRYGQKTDRGSRIFEGKTHTFKQVGNSTIISRNADKANVYKNGKFSKDATIRDRGAIAALPAKAESLSQKLKQSQQKTTARSR